MTENLRSSDPYMVMADFKDYRRAQADLQKLYADREKWAHMSLKNIANSGIFSADRSVLDYAHDIWYASPVPWASNFSLKKSICPGGVWPAGAFFEKGRPCFVLSVQ